MKVLIRGDSSSKSQIIDFGGVRISIAAFDYIWRNVGRNPGVAASTGIFARNQWSWNKDELDDVNSYLRNWEIESKLGLAVPMKYHQIKPEHVEFDKVRDQHMVQRIEERLGVTWEQLQTDEGKKYVLDTLQSYIDEAVVRFKQDAKVKEDDNEGNTRVKDKSKNGVNLSNSVYIADNGTVIIEMSSDAKIVTFYTSEEYKKDDKNTELVIKVVKLCNIESLDISIPPEEL